MKKITLLLSFIVCVVFAQAQLLLTEDFNYTVDTELKANGWVGTGATPSTINPIKVTTASISYSAYPGSGIGNEISLTTSGEDLNKSYNAITSGTIYYSAIVNLSAAQTTGDYFLHIGDLPSGTSYFGRAYAKLVGEKIAFGVLKVSGGTVAPTYSDAVYDLNTSYLIVVKTDITNGTSSLIVNPTLGTEPTTGWLSNSDGSTAFPVAGLKTINVRQGTAANAPTLKIDAIRVATSWAALFSTTGTSNPSSSNELSAFVSGKNLMIKNAVEGSKVEIYSALGSKVLTSTLEDGKVSLDNLSKGLYVVRIGKKAQKFML